MREKEALKIAHLSDFHIGKLSSHWRDWVSKGFIAQLNYFLRLHRGFEIEVLRELPKFLRAQNVDLVVVTGDFTTAGSEGEFDIALAFFEQLKMENLPCLHVPGNHDHYSRRKRNEGYFGKLYPLMQQAKSAQQLFDKRCELKTFGEQSENPWDIWLLDQTSPTSWISSNGHFDNEATAEFAAAQRARTCANSLVCGHFPLHSCSRSYRELIGRKALRGALGDRPENRLYIHGHTHQFHIVDERPQRGFVSVDAGSCTQVGRAGFNIYELHPSSATIHRYQRENAPSCDIWRPVHTYSWSWKPQKALG